MPALSQFSFAFVHGTTPGLWGVCLCGISTILCIAFLAMQGFPGSLDGKASAYNAGDLGSIPGLERSPGEGNGNPLQYSCLENPMDRGAW